MGTEKDPEHEDKTGSNPLRQGCPTEEALRRGFTLVYLSRTVRLRLYFLLAEVAIFEFRSCTCTTEFSTPSELVDFVGAPLSRTRGTVPIYMLEVRDSNGWTLKICRSSLLDVQRAMASFHPVDEAPCATPWSFAWERADVATAC